MLRRKGRMRKRILQLGLPVLSNRPVGNNWRLNWKLPSPKKEGNSSGLGSRADSLEQTRIFIVKY